MWLFYLFLGRKLIRINRLVVQPPPKETSPLFRKQRVKSTFVFTVFHIVTMYSIPRILMPNNSFCYSSDIVSSVLCNFEREMFNLIGAKSKRNNYRIVYCRYSVSDVLFQWWGISLPAFINLIPKCFVKLLKFIDRYSYLRDVRSGLCSSIILLTGSNDGVHTSEETMQP